MPDHNEGTQRQEETAQDIFRQLSSLISERLREGREESATRSPRCTDLDEEIKDELRRLREAIRQDEVAHAAEVDQPRDEPTARIAVPLGIDVDSEERRPLSEMSEGLRILFRGGQLEPEPATGAEPPAEPVEPATAAEPPTEPVEVAAVAEPSAEPSAAGEPSTVAEPSVFQAVPQSRAESRAQESPYFATFSRGLAETPVGLATGLPQLDDLLGGGLEPGLYVVTGPPGSGGRALLLNMLWKTVSEGRTARYYCLATGAQRVWEEMVITLSHLLGENPLSRSDLRRSKETGSQTNDVRRLDAILMQSFLPYVTLHESLPASPFPLTAFLRELDGGRGPSAPPDLVLLDGLPQLLATLQVPDALTGGSLLLELDVLLRNRGVPGLLLSEGASGSRGRWEEQGLEHLGSGLIAMRRHGGRRKHRLGLGLEQLSLRVLKQPGGLRQGRVVLVLDTASGMLAEAPHRPGNDEREPQG